MYIQELRVETFRHLRDAKFGPFRQPINPSELIILAGPNGGGKSSVLELLSQALASRLGWSYWASRNIQGERYCVKIGLDEAEIIELLHSDAEERNRSLGRQIGPIGPDANLAGYLRKERAYWIDVNCNQVSDADRPLNDRVLHLAQRRYSNFSKKLGFFIRSERSYQTRGYSYGNMLNRARRFVPNHFNTFSFNSTAEQYNEIHEFLIEQSYDHTRKLGEYLKAITRGETATLPTDPIEPYNGLLAQIFPGYSFVDVDEEHLFLRIKLPTDNVIPFQDLSSGEKEVFFILALFVRHSINNSIIVIDEPELHLHPELARKLLRSLRTIQPNNQIWCATHSAELIDEAGRERTYFLKASVDRTTSECIPATSEKAELNILRDMYGYSGYVGLSKKVVFSEGVESSADRKTFTNLFPQKASEIKIISAGGYQQLYRVNAAVLSLLESDFARCEFYLIRDRDFLSDEAVAKHSVHAPGRLFVLNRYHIENYLLDEEIISAVLGSIYQKKKSPNQVRDELLNIARELSGPVLRDLAESRLNELYQAEDCSIGSHSNSLAAVDANGAVASSVVGPMRNAILTNIAVLNSTIAMRTSGPESEKIFDEALESVRAALSSDKWLSLFPGRLLLQKFSTRNGLGDWPVLQNLIIEEMSKNPQSVPSDLKTIFDKIVP